MTEAKDAAEAVDTSEHPAIIDKRKNPPAPPAVKAKKDPVFDAKKPHVQVRDRALPNVAFQQGENLFDRKKAFVSKTDLVLNIPEPKPVEFVVKDIKERKIRNNKSVVGKVRKSLLTGDPAKETAGSPYVRHTQRNGVGETLRAAAKENASARSAENAA